MDGAEFDGRVLRVQFAMQRRPDNPREYYAGQVRVLPVLCVATVDRSTCAACQYCNCASFTSLTVREYYAGNVCDASWFEKIQAGTSQHCKMLIALRGGLKRPSAMDEHTMDEPRVALCFMQRRPDNPREYYAGQVCVTSLIFNGHLQSWGQHITAH